MSCFPPEVRLTLYEQRISGETTKIRLLKFAVMLLFLVIARATPARAAEKQQSNIAYIVADDLGWKDVGYYGPDIKTPYIDKLAEDGARLEQFYAHPTARGHARLR